MPHLHVIGPATYADSPAESSAPTDTAPSEPTSPGHPTDEAAPVVLTAARVARLPRQRVTPRTTDSGPDAA
jgi:hypothetical protein